MPESLLDCRGLSCPDPLIRTRDLLAAGRPETLTVLVDNPASNENVNRFLTSQGFVVATVETGGAFRLTAVAGDAPAQAPEEERRSGEKILVLIASATFGVGSDELGAALMKNFLSTLPEMGDSLWRIVLLNGGVTLAAEPGPCLEHLQKLEAAGVGVFVCGACLEHYKLMDKKAVGQTTNMLDVITGLQLADKVLRI